MASSSHLFGRVHLLIAALAVLAAWPSLIYGGMSYPPKSYVIPSADGDHIFVMLSPVEEAEDEKSITKLPNGRVTNLQSTYPKSGYYEIDSAVPIWTVDDFGHQHSTHLSSDGRYLLIVSASNEYYSVGPPGKERVIYESMLFQGVTFYDNGTKIAEYTQYDLVDYPRLIPYDGWADESNWDELNQGPPWSRLRVDGNRFELKTTTRDRFVFDITNGKILEEFRFWRLIHRAAIVIASLLGIGVFCVIESILRFRRHVQPRPVSPTKVPRPREESLRISMRGLFVYTTMFCLALGISSYSMTTGIVVAAGILLVIGFKKSSGLISEGWGIAIFFVVIPLLIALWIWLPHVAIPVTCLTVSVLLTRWLLTFHAGKSHTAFSIVAMLILGVSTFICWIAFYVASIAPTFTLLQKIDSSTDVQAAVAHTLYAPIIWCDENLFYRELFNSYGWYVRTWGGY
jgi:hypothetical protein